MPSKPNNSKNGELQPTKTDGTFTFKNGGEIGSSEVDSAKEEKNESLGQKQLGSVPSIEGIENILMKDDIGFSAPKYAWQTNPDMLAQMKAYAQKMANDKQVAIEEQHKKEIEEAEKALGGDRKGLYETYKLAYELDPKLIEKATDEEIAALKEAILKSEELNDLQKSYQNKVAELEKQVEESHPDTYHFAISVSPKLANIWKGKYNVSLDEYEQLKDSIPAKKAYFQELINSPDTPPSKIKECQEKIEALNQFEKWGEETKDDFAKHKSLQQELDELKNNPPSNDPKALDQHQKTIEKYQNPNAMYSIARKEKAVWCKTYEQASKAFGKEAELQRKNMTQEEIDKLAEYTGSGSSTINKPLYGMKWSSGYGEKEVAMEKAMESIKLLTSALDKSKSSRDVWLQRGVESLKIGNKKIDTITNESELQKLIGAEMIHPSVMSCGAAKGTGFSGNGIIMNIYCPKGTKMHYVDDISSYKGENEMIVGRGYHYIVKKIVKSKGHIYIDLDLQIGSDADRMSDDEMRAMYDKHLY